MADVPASPPAAKLHLIDEKKAFSSGFEQFVRDTALVRAGFDYNVVAVFGSQSTGKSMHSANCRLTHGKVRS